MFSKVKKIGLLAVLAAAFALSGLAQEPQIPKYKSQELSETDGVPVLLKHLPDWESHKDTAFFASKPGELETVLGERPILSQIDFTAGTEAATAQYPAGRLVIVEYTSPQASSEADQLLSQAADSTTVYRRIGNYNAFVLDVTDVGAANALLDQVKYEKNIQWLGNNPFRISAERAFAMTTADIFMSTVIVIVIGIGVALVFGAVFGLVYFQRRERRRAAMEAYTDAGGMTRLNLDGFTSDLASERLLGE